MNPQEPPSHIPTATSGQPQEKVALDTSTKVDSTVAITTTAKEQEKDQTGQRDTSVSTAQEKGAPPQIKIVDQDRTEEESPKEKEQETIQTLINFPTTRTPTRTSQQLRIEAIQLQISALVSSSTKVARVLHYGDPTLDE